MSKSDFNRNRIMLEDFIHYIKCSCGNTDLKIDAINQVYCMSCGRSVIDCRDNINEIWKDYYSLKSEMANHKC